MSENAAGTREHARTYVTGLAISGPRTAASPNPGIVRATFDVHIGELRFDGFAEADDSDRERSPS